jgi:hypothetical protein
MTDARAVALWKQITEEMLVAKRAGMSNRDMALFIDGRAIPLIATALAEEWERVFVGLKVTNEQLEWALKTLGPTGTNAEAYVKATVQYVISCRQQANRNKEVSDANR